jgi:hypothetical protein
MPPAAAIPAGASLVGSFLQSNSSKNAAKANTANQTSLDQQMLGIYDQLLGKFNSLWSSVNPSAALGEAKNFYSSEVLGGLSPAVIGSAESQFQQQNARNLGTMENQLGPYTPNIGGAIRDFSNNEIMGNVSLQQQLAAMNQGVRQQGAAGLAGIGSDVAGLMASVGQGVAGGIGGLASQFGQANEFNALNAGPNPFSSIGSILSAYPGLFGGGGSSGGASQTPGGYTGPGLSGQPYPQPGQGGLGAPGGAGFGFG